MRPNIKYKRGCIFSMVIGPAFRMGQYRVNEYRVNPMKSTVIQSKRRLSTLISDGESVDTKNKRKRIRNLVRVSLPNPRKIYFHLNLQLKAARTLGLLSIQIFLAWMPYLFLTIFKINQSETSKILSERLRIYLMAKNRQKFFMQL